RRRAGRRGLRAGGTGRDRDRRGRDVILALVHSPLTGPLVCDPAQAELARRGVRATIPEVADHPSGTGAYFEQHARSVARSLRGVCEELRPGRLEFFVEPIRVFEGWPDAPCGYLRLSAAYDPALARANTLAWPTRSLDAGHFHLLVEPQATVEAILDLLQEM